MINRDRNFIEQLAQVIDYDTYIKYNQTYCSYIRDGKSDIEAKKMAAYHWEEDKKTARFKAEQIILRIEYDFSKLNVFKRIWLAIKL